MKCILHIQVLLLLLFINVRALASETEYNYGLYFNSYSVPGDKRTSLFLDNGNPFPVKNQLTVSFQMLVRSNEPDFGSILHFQTNENQLIHFTFASGSNNQNSPALVFNEGMSIFNLEVKKEKWVPVSLCLDIKNNTLNLDYGGRDTTIVIPLRGTKTIKISFGCFSGYAADIVPMNLRNVKINSDGKDIRYWKLWRHNGKSCIDELSGSEALAENPYWLIDNHIEWKKIYSADIKGRLDVAFNPRNALFYLVKQDRIETLDANTGIRSEIRVRGGYPAMEYTDHLVYDSISSCLLSYSLDKKIISSFSFDDKTWSLRERHKEEPSYYNHARAFNPKDSSYYFFGGYGFYRYRSNLFRLKVGEKRIEAISYFPNLAPRYSAAAGVLGDELYIFGGRGNTLGKQEFNSYYYNELCAINLKTYRSRILWRKRGGSDSLLIMASSMYFNPSDSSFYAVCMKNGGTLWKISMKDSVCMEISKPIHNELVYQDCDFSLYKSLNYHKMFLVIDKILSNKVHNIAIYSINTPVIGEEEIVQSRNKTSMIMWVLFSSFLLILCIIVVCVIYYSHRKKKQNPINLKNEDDALQYGLKIDEFKNLQVENEKNEIYFDRSRSAISLLGTFNVRDKSGRDITCSFSPRLKELLIFLILNTEKDNQGVLAKRVMDTLWNDKDEISARNNCNVTLRKLRILLESIGKVEVLSDSGFLRIVWGEDVFCDYHASLSCIKYFKQNELKGDRSLLNEVLEILLYGPLLSNTILEWIDEFKDAYSSISIDLLSELLHLGLQQQNDILVLRIADTMFLHDPLNEEALSAKCSILFSQGKKGIAKSVYERFCKEYKDLLGENYKTSLSDLYK